MNLFLLYVTLSIAFTSAAQAQASIEPLEALFDECLVAKQSGEASDLSIEERNTDFGTVTVGKSSTSCTIMGFSETYESYEIAGNSVDFIGRFASWMTNREPDFDKAQVIRSENDRVILAACVDNAWQVIASSSTIEAVATEAMRNDPRWVTDFGRVAVAIFFAEGPRGNNCATQG